MIHCWTCPHFSLQSCKRLLTFCDRRSLSMLRAPLLGYRHRLKVFSASRLLLCSYRAVFFPLRTYWGASPTFWNDQRSKASSSNWPAQSWLGAHPLHLVAVLGLALAHHFCAICFHCPRLRLMCHPLQVSQGHDHWHLSAYACWIWCWLSSSAWSWWSEGKLTPSGMEGRTDWTGGIVLESDRRWPGPSRHSSGLLQAQAQSFLPFRECDSTLVEWCCIGPSSTLREGTLSAG